MRNSGRNHAGGGSTIAASDVSVSMFPKPYKISAIIAPLAVPSLDALGTHPAFCRVESFRKRENPLLIPHKPHGH
jgi:hypothetical protein